MFWRCCVLLIACIPLAPGLQDQVRLRLKDEKEPMDVLVIDGADRELLPN
jgi:hypothetical protein